jgi:hypothetical protein
LTGGSEKQEENLMAQDKPMKGLDGVTKIAKATFIHMIDQREQEGIEKYGRSLETFNGRDAAQDLLEEVIDGIQYATQLSLEYDYLIEKLASLYEIHDGEEPLDTQWEQAHAVFMAMPPGLKTKLEIE